MDGISLMLDGEASDTLLPMHLRLSWDGSIMHAGPTIRKILALEPHRRRRFFDSFEIRRPAGVSDLRALVEDGPRRLQIALRRPPLTTFKGIAVGGTGGSEILLNLSFGISIVEAIRDYDLTSSDFAHTDLAIEMLYLVEAKEVILDEWRSLNTRLAAAKMAAEDQAYTDTLTGLKNRRALDRVLSDLCLQRQPLGLIQLDLDFFKTVNDTFGHAAGDHVLQAAAKTIVAGTRADDTLIRAGGDEFVLILPDLTDIRRLQELAGRLIDALETPIQFGGETCRISGSAGIAVTSGTPALSPDTLLERADRALYASKKSGRGRVTVYADDLPKLGADKL